jgi:uncharacterized Zn-binding protein involved in type VI secretion
MPQLVVNGAQLSCTFGMAPSAMTVLPKNRVNAGGQPAANIGDNIPMANIMPFGMCQSLANPQVAAATTAAMGVLTPQPCIPVTTSPWAPGSATVMIAGMPALNSTCKLMCNWAGVISVVSPGQFTVNVA